MRRFYTQAGAVVSKLGEIYGHGHHCLERQTMQEFNALELALRRNGYTNGMVGFRWIPGLPAEADAAARGNGARLAQFILDYKIHCPCTAVRLVGSSRVRG